MSDPRDRPQEPPSVESLAPDDRRESDNDEAVNPAGLQRGDPAEGVEARRGGERSDT